MTGYDAWRTAEPPEARTRTYTEEAQECETCATPVEVTEYIVRGEVDHRDYDCGRCKRRLRAHEVRAAGEYATWMATSGA